MLPWHCRVLAMAFVSLEREQMYFHPSISLDQLVSSKLVLCMADMAGKPSSLLTSLLAGYAGGHSACT
jgi:hypothetical protein